jgi:MFS family permease
MDRVLGSRKKVVFGGALISAFFLGALALVSQPPLWLAVALLIAACFFCAFGTVIVAQGRTLFPDRLGGRAVTTVNMAQCLGLTVLPAVTGYIVEAFGATDFAYRIVFATLAGGLLLALIPYARSPDNASR